LYCISNISHYFYPWGGNTLVGGYSLGAPGDPYQAITVVIAGSDCSKACSVSAINVKERSRVLV
jgi:hypothetical protein